MRENGKAVISISAREATLKRRLRRHLAGFHKTEDGMLAPPGTGKDVIRTVHNVQGDDRLTANWKFIFERFPKVIKHFASGADIDAARISPVLQQISSKTWEGDLFRLASLTWSIPVSNGFGRRLRYLVWDEQALSRSAPVFNLSVRDNLIQWDVRARGEPLVNIMDAYVLGAPPYKTLLGGKLVLWRSRHDGVRSWITFSRPALFANDAVPFVRRILRGLPQPGRGKSSIKQQ